MECTPSQCFPLVVAAVATGCIVTQIAAAQQEDNSLGTPVRAVDPFPATFADPAAPLLQLPTKFRARRTSSGLSANKDRPVDILNVEGAGCVRHIWIVFGNQFDFGNAEIEVMVDDAPEPQVRMPIRSFLGLLLGFEAYHIDSAALAIFPNFTITNDRHIPPKAKPGSNFYLPIPFAESCRITVYSETVKGGAAMVDWQQYHEDVELTPLRLCAQ
jgi:hypothetical protein